MKQDIEDLIKRYESDNSKRRISPRFLRVHYHLADTLERDVTNEETAMFIARVSTQTLTRINGIGLSYAAALKKEADEYLKPSK